MSRSLRHICSIFKGPRPRRFPSNNLRLPRTLGRTRMGPPSNRNNLGVDPLFPKRPTGIFKDSIHLPPRFHPVPRPPNQRFVIQGGRKSGVVRMNHTITTRGPFPRFFPNRRLRCNMVAYKPNFHFPITEEGKLKATRPMIMRFFENRNSTTTTNSNPKGMGNIFSTNRKEERTSFRKNKATKRCPPRRFTPSSTNSPIFRGRPRCFSFLHGSTITNNIFGVGRFFLDRSTQFSTFDQGRKKVKALSRIHPTFFHRPMRPFMRIQLGMIVQVHGARMEHHNYPSSHIANFHPTKVFLYGRTRAAISKDVFPSSTSKPIN